MTKQQYDAQPSWRAGFRLGWRGAWYDQKAQLRKPGLAILTVISFLVLLGLPVLVFIGEDATVAGGATLIGLILLATGVIAPVVGMYQYLVAHNLYRVRYLPHGKASLLGSLLSPVWLAFPVILAVGAFIGASLFHDVNMGLGAVGATLLATVIVGLVGVPLGIIAATFVRGLASYMVVFIALSGFISGVFNLAGGPEGTGRYEYLIDAVSTPLVLGVAILSYAILAAVVWVLALWRWGRFFDGLTAVKLQRMTPTSSRG